MSAKIAEKLTILLDVGSGMMSRLSLPTRTLSSPGGRPHALQNPDWKSLRKRLESKFPELDTALLS